MGGRASPGTVVPIVLTIALLAVLGGGSTGSRFGMDIDLGDSAASFTGEVPEDHSGRSIASAGDVNGDGYDDILIGARANDEAAPDAGQTYLILGRASGWAMDTDLSNADASFRGEGRFDYSGETVAGAGDVNNDGYDDILISAPDNDDGGQTAGQTYLVLGRASGWAMDSDLSDADASFWGEGAGDRSGYSIAGAGDVNGDGFDDILIGAEGNDEGGTDAGQVYLVFGRASGWSMDTNLSESNASFWGENEADYSGYSVAGAGDVNGDGYDDILIGALLNSDGSHYSGQTYLVLGKASGWSMDTSLSTADASFWGEGADDRSGSSVAGAGDVDGDGYDDILIGSERNDEGGSDAGQTYLVLGRASGWAMDANLSNADASFLGEDADDWSGFSVAGAGDINADGFDDILIGATGDEDGGGANAGQTYLVLGRGSGWAMDTDLSDANASFVGEAMGDRSGTSVVCAGDFNGDGYDDILIGAHANDGGGSNAGQTYLVFYLSGLPPTWGALPVLRAVEDVPVTYDLSSNVSDPDTPSYDLEITSVSPYVTSVDRLNVTFQFPNGVLEADVPLVLDDGGFGVPAVVHFVVQPVNDPPEHDIPGLQEVMADEPWTMDLAPHVWDVDNGPEDLVLVVDSPFATVEGLNLTMTIPRDIFVYDLWFNISDGIDSTPVKLRFTVLGPPGPPTNFMVTPGNGSVDLEWRAPRHNGGSSILGYRVLRGPSPDALSLVSEVGDATVEYTDAGVTNGVVCHYALLAFNNLGDSVLTDVLSAMPVGPPGAPKGFVVTPGNGSVTLTWEQPDSDGGEPVGGYRVLRGTGEGSLEFLAIALDTTYVDLEVRNGQTYYYRVQAENGAGAGPGTGVLGGTPVGPPKAVRTPTITPGLKSLLITWMAPADDGGSPITGYRIYRGESRDAMELHEELASSVREYKETGLEAGRDYHYRVTALNGHHEGEPSSYLTGVPWGLPSAPRDLVVTAGDGVAWLEWRAPERDGGLRILGYIVYRGTDPGTLPELALLGDVASCTDDTAENGVTYYYAVAAVNEMGYGEFAWSPGVTPLEPPVRPSMVTVGEPHVTRKAVTLVWTAPVNDGGSPVTGYVIYRGTVEGELEAVTQVGPDVLNWTDLDVKQGRTYWYSVAPENDVGEGEPAPALKVVVPEREESPGFGTVVAFAAAVTAWFASTRRREEPS